MKRLLENWDNPDSPERKRYEASAAKWEKKLKPLFDAIENSERITAADRALMVY
jgi:hypothetical protein